MFFASLKHSSRLLRLGVRTSGFHPDSRGSNPLGDAYIRQGKAKCFFPAVIYLPVFLKMRSYGIPQSQ